MTIKVKVRPYTGNKLYVSFYRRKNKRYAKIRILGNTRITWLDLAQFFDAKRAAKNSKAVETMSNGIELTMPLSSFKKHFENRRIRN